MLIFEGGEQKILVTLGKKICYYIIRNLKLFHFNPLKRCDVMISTKKAKDIIHLLKLFGQINS